ncbi:hypothetical protein HBH1_02072 [Herbaspirillum sp. BH-1]|uniref:hypothetical protein n=1 Tax=Herbaspirillum sp. (strain BH-1) TaxID=2058884 RepID=UPI000C88A444|nr:hypothetical protein [Herbaspirillum sp. BH-1]PLY59562.1 hypothetical protein HBH1_02072 [Herbaspirillum sp. BH-1]
MSINTVEVTALVFLRIVKMNKKLVAALSSLLLMMLMSGSVSAETKINRTNVDIPGFKKVLFGMSSEDVSKLGAYCKSDGMGFGGMDPVACSGSETLFGNGAAVTVYFTGNKAHYIGVTVSSAQPIDLITPYTKAYGTPNTAVIQNAAGMNFRINFWLSPTGKSIQLTTPLLDDGVTPRAKAKDNQGRFTETAAYYDEQRTYELMQKVKARLAPEKDY